MSFLEFERLSYARLREVSARFLEEHHPDRTLPTPIEEIVERRLKINIIPVPGLQGVFAEDGPGVEGFLTSDLQDLLVDDWVMMNRPSRYRFTLAHEVGHFVFHRRIYETHRFNTIDARRAFMNSVSEEDLREVEWQAYAFAGLILVPERALKTVVDECVKDAIGRLQVNGLSLKAGWEAAWDFVYESVAKPFEVSAEVIRRRVDYDRLQDIYR
ncbi:MAG: ImmA/IrrE family metallo-endopeptidase [Planctomycetota bacterium]